MRALELAEQLGDEVTELNKLVRRTTRSSARPSPHAIRRVRWRTCGRRTV